MTRDNLGFDNEAFNALMARVVMVIFAAVAIVLLLGVVAKPAEAAHHSVAQQSTTGHPKTVSAVSRP